MARAAAIDPKHVPASEEDLKRCLQDPMWRLSNLYKIIVKGDGEKPEDGLVMRFRPNRAQRRFLAAVWHRNVILKARQLGFCVSPETRVLTASLEWKAITEVKPGEEVVACDEHGAGGKGQARRMRTAEVMAVRHMQAERFRITFDDGRNVVCTDRHPWLSRKAGCESKWRSLSGQGNQVAGRLKIGTQVRWVTKPWDAPTIEDGWMGGMLDGEGSMAKDCHGAGINVSQRAGKVWDRLVRYASERGYHAKIEGDIAIRESKHGKAPVPKLAFNRMDEIFRLIGQTRPERFIGRRWWEGKELPGKRDSGTGWSTVTGIEPLGIGEVVDMQTSAGTYIAEGFVSHNTTLICLLWLDTALFTPNMRCGIIAHDRESAEAIFRDKVKFAYDNLPGFIKAGAPLKKDSATELLFAHNNSSVRVATSMRSGTIHRLLISELGKTAAKHREKAAEVMTGSIPAVPQNGILVVESTAEGREGEFYDMVQVARELHDGNKDLSERDYRLHFFPWWEEPNYTMPAGATILSDADREYFAKVEAAIGRRLSEGQKAWYVATRNADFRSNPERMWQEYPSTIDEAFQVSTEGCYYTAQLTLARQQGRIGKVPHDPAYPVNTFWDIGKRDSTAIWFHQRINGQDRFIDFYERTDQPYSHFAQVLQGKPYTYGTHYLPHDADHERQGERVNKTPEEMLNDLGIRNTYTLERVQDKVRHGIYPTRDAFGTCLFDEERCKDGLIHLELYRKEWDDRLGVWRETPRHDEHSNAADAFRQFGQAKHLIGTQRPLHGAPVEDRRRAAMSRPRRNWRIA